MNRMNMIEYKVSFLTNSNSIDVCNDINSYFRSHVEDVYAVNDINSVISCRPATVHDLGLSVRAFNTLARNNIWLIEDLCGRTEHELMALNGMGDKTMQEINKVLGHYGLKLKEEEKNG